jgi:selenocysteine lyase/cysteine desulfurase
MYDDAPRLAPDMRRFDLSPAWPVWVGTAPAIELFADLHRSDAKTATAVASYGADLADRVRSALDREPGNRPVLAFPDEGGRLKSALESAGCRVSGRGKSVRFGFHLWNTEDDLDRVVDVLARWPRRPAP